MTEKTRLILCPECGVVLNIEAIHYYDITQDDERKFHRTDGDVTYRCSACGATLHISQIEDALRQVDEV